MGPLLESPARKGGVLYFILRYGAPSYLFQARLR